MDCSKKVMGQRFEDIFSKETVPILYSISIVLIFLALGMSVYKIISGNFGNKGSKVSKVFSDAE